MKGDREILAELHRLIEEQFRTLEGKLSDSAVEQYNERSRIIRDLFQQLKAANGDSRQPVDATKLANNTVPKELLDRRDMESSN
jgi:hypothetical protein